MKIYFIIPRYFYSYKIPNIPHPGIAQLSAILLNNNIDHEILDNHFIETEAIIEKIRNESPDLLAFTAYSPGYLKAYKLMGEIKSRCDVPIVLGGPHLTIFRKKVLEDESSIDFGIKHEGEHTFIELIDALRTGKDLQGINGLIWKKGPGNIIENDDKPYLTSAELNRLPIPDYSKFDIKSYLCYQEKLLPLITSRGCPYQCTYCSVKLTQGRRFRSLEPERIIDEIKLRIAEGWNIFDIHDDCFSLDLKRAKKFCDLIIQENLKIRYKFNNGIRADRLDEELLEKLKNSGCEFIAFGLESANSDILKSIKKGISRDRLALSLSQAQKLNIRTAVNFIIGLQEETYSQALESINYAASLKNTHINLANAIPYPGTEFYDWIENNGRFLYRPEEYLNQIGYQDMKPVFETAEFSKHLREKALAKGSDLCRTRELQQKLGKNIGSVAALFYKYNFVHILADRFFKGNVLGRKLYLKVLKKQ